MMDDEIRENLIQKYSKEELVELILKLSKRHDGLFHSLIMLTGEKNEFREQFYKGLAQFSERKRFYAWDESREFHGDLEELLFNLEQGAIDPSDGLLGLKAFFEHDEYFVESSHSVERNLFDTTAIDLFIKYSHQIEDKNWVYGLVIQLLECDEYHLRECLSESFHKILPESLLRQEVNSFLMDQEKSKLKPFIVLDIARGLNDPLLLEKTYSLTDKSNPEKIYLEVGELWLKKGDADLAIKYLEQIKIDNFSADKLLLEAYRQTGQREKEKKLLWKVFNSEQTKESFDSLIEAEGENKYQLTLEAEVQRMKKSLKLDERHVTFFLAMELYEEAEKYIWDRFSQLDGDHYYDLLRWAGIFEERKQRLIASAIYRKLINSILERAHSKAYHYGVDYLFKLIEFEPLISSWPPIEPHEVYFSRIKKEHGRKSSFWGQYKQRRGDE